MSHHGWLDGHGKLQLLFVRSWAHGNLAMAHQQSGYQPAGDFCNQFIYPEAMPKKHQLMTRVATQLISCQSTLVSPIVPRCVTCRSTTSGNSGVMVTPWMRPLGTGDWHSPEMETPSESWQVQLSRERTSIDCNSVARPCLCRAPCHPGA